MSTVRRSKKTIILEEFIEKITSGSLENGSFFPSIKELAANYQISLRTASTVIQELREKNFLLTGSGRRSQVVSQYHKPEIPFFSHPIGIVCSGHSDSEMSHWEEWICQRLRQKLQDKGACSVRLMAGVPDLSDPKLFSGFLIVCGSCPHGIREKLLTTHLPCVSLSFERPLSNTVYVDCRPAMMRLALYLARKKFEKIIFLANQEWESRDLFNWCYEVGFLQTLQEYGVDAKGCQRLVMGGSREESWERFRKTNLQTSDKTIFLTFNTSSLQNQSVMEFMKSVRLIWRRDYEIISLTATPDESRRGACLDMKCEEMADNLIAMLFACEWSGTRQLAEIIVPEFREYDSV